MELGTIQKAWIKSLREHPERQTSNCLGYKSKDSEDYKACCLGEALCVLYRINGKNAFDLFNNGRLLDFNNSILLNEVTAYRLGLHTGNGHVEYGTNGSSFFIYKKQILDSLSSANDAGMTWPEIADFIEKYPESVFTKSV